MKYLNGKYYLKVNDKQYIIHPTEKSILGERKSPQSLRTQYQVMNETQLRKNQKVSIYDKDELEVKR